MNATTTATTAAATATTSNTHPWPQPELQEIFPTFNSDNSIPKYHQKPRKKRSKLIRINNLFGASPSTCSTKPKYTKKPDPSAPKITRPCSECGKKFWSWKALFGHMRCHPERQWRGINPPPNLKPRDSPQISETYDFEDMMTEEDRHVARCLLMLANGPIPSEIPLGSDSFECASCKKVFGSRQALGGHRASHKNVKGCFAINRNDGEEDEDRVGYERNGEGEEDNNLMVLGHKCGICLRVFSSGQALGGHKRCHWDQKGDKPSSSSLTTQVVSPRVGCGLDLNLPAPQDYDSSSSYSSGLALDLRLGL